MFGQNWLLTGPPVQHGTAETAAYDAARTIMRPDLRHPYGFRAWLRQRLPWWAIRIGVAGKGRDCETRGAEHHWYNIDHATSGCYYCRVERAGCLWRAPGPLLHEHDVVRILSVSDSAKQEAIDSGYSRAPQPGDEGAIVSLYGEGGPAYVEKVAPDGSTEWLATFNRDEIEVVWCCAARAAADRQ